MSDTFHLLDLPSQAIAVQHLLSGRPAAEKLAWLSVRGRLERVETRVATDRLVYHFESFIGLGCALFIDEDEFVFFGDHTTYTANR
ncbi:hypothetical protein ACYOEI_12175 [Singulisphaera rosea]